MVSVAEPEVLASGLWLHRGAIPPMREYHRHDDVEINVALVGDLAYLFGGTRLVVPEGSVALFWAAAPHRLVDVEPDRASDVVWVHLPLFTVLSWALPDTFSRRVLAQQPVVVPIEAVGAHVVDQVLGWRRELDGPSRFLPERRTVVELEANALVLRVLAASRHRPQRLRAGRDLRPVAVMAQFIADRFRDPISTADVARAADLNPNYATTLFRTWCGSTLGDQLVRQRVAEAQRLLLTTDLTVTSVAHASGFGSQSSLYAHFDRLCGQPPGDYRRDRRAWGR